MVLQSPMSQELATKEKGWREQREVLEGKLRKVEEATAGQGERMQKSVETLKQVG